MASYKGKDGATADDLNELTNKKEVKVLLGKKDLVIKHNVPENLIAIY